MSSSSRYRYGRGQNRLARIMLRRELFHLNMVAMPLISPSGRQTEAHNRRLRYHGKRRSLREDLLCFHQYRMSNRSEHAVVELRPHILRVYI
jgi:hypothetical protein